MMTVDDRAAALAALRERVLAAPCAGGYRPIFGVGPATARVMVVGEGPAERDEHTGAPFSGPAGALLKTTLHDVGLDPETLWLTNVLTCRLTRQREGRTVNRPPTEAELTAALPLLDEQIALIQPAVVIGLGATAGRALLGKGFNLNRDRGQWFSRLDGPAVLVTYLAAYVLRREGPDYDEAYAILRGPHAA